MQVALKILEGQLRTNQDAVADNAQTAVRIVDSYLATKTYEWGILHDPFVRNHRGEDLSARRNFVDLRIWYELLENPQRLSCAISCDASVDPLEPPGELVQFLAVIALMSEDGG